MDVQCTESESGEPSLAIGGTDGWAYVMYLEIPPESTKTGILRRGGRVITRADLNNPDAPLLVADRWTSELPIFDDEVAIVRQSSGTAIFPEETPADPLIFKHRPGSIFQSIPPGVYDIRVVAYQKTRVPNFGSDVLGQAIRNAPRQESELTVELGDCEAYYNAEERLENVDQNMLERYKKLGEAKAKYSEARRSFGDNVQSLTDSILSGGAKAAVKKGAKLKDILTGAVGPGDLNTVASIQDDLEKGTQAQKSFDKRVTDIKELQSKKSAIFDGVERCNGEPYSLEEYSAPSPSEIQDAINSGADAQ